MKFYICTNKKIWKLLSI